MLSNSVWEQLNLNRSMIHGGVVLEEPGGEPAPVPVSGFDDGVLGFVAYHVDQG